MPSPVGDGYKKEYFINIKDYGCKGDFNPMTGIGTNDTQNFWIAAQAAQAGGAALMVPFGKFLITDGPPTSAPPPVLTLTVNGSAGQQFSITIIIGGTPYTTAALNYNAPANSGAGNVQAALVAALPPPGAGVTVTGGTGGAGGAPYTITFPAALGSVVLQPNVVTGTPTFSISNPGGLGVQSVQSLTVVGTANFTLTFALGGSSYTSSAVAGNASAAALQAALPSALNGTTVTGGPGNTAPYVLTFPVPLGAPVIQPNPGSGQTITVSTLSSVGGMGNQNVQSVSVGSLVTGGTFKLTVTLGSTSYTTPAIAYNAAANSGTATSPYNNVQAALVSVLPSWASALTVTGGPGVTAPFTITFPASVGAPFMTVDSSLLTGGVATVTIVSSGAALVLKQLSGLRIVGEGRSRYADYDVPLPLLQNVSPSMLVFGGTEGGVMFDLQDCSDITAEYISFVGQATSWSTSAARIGLLASNGTSGLSLKGCFFGRIYSRATTPIQTACLQFGLNIGDGNCDTLKFFDGELSGMGLGAGMPQSNGIVFVNSESVGHHMSAVNMYSFTNGVWFQAGGDFLWETGVTEGVGTVLKLGNALGPTYAGGPK